MHGLENAQELDQALQDEAPLRAQTAGREPPPSATHVWHHPGWGAA